MGKRKSKSKGHVGIGPRLASGTATVVPPAPHSTVDYRKFDNINVSSDDEEEVKKQSSAPDSLYQKIDQGCRCEMCQQFTEETPQLPSPDYGRRPSEDNESLGSEEEEEEEDYVVQLPPQKGSKALAPKPTQQPPQAIKRGFFGSKPTTSASIKPTGMGFTDPSAKSGGRITGTAQGKESTRSLDDESMSEASESEEMPPLVSDSDDSEGLAFDVLKSQGYNAYLKAQFQRLVNRMEQSKSGGGPPSKGKPKTGAPASDSPPPSKQAKIAPGPKTAAKPKAVGKQKAQKAAPNDGSRSTDTDKPSAVKAEAKPPVSEQDSAKSTIAAAKVRQEATKRPDTASKGQKAEAMNVENDMPGLQSDEEEEERYAASLELGSMASEMAERLRNLNVLGSTSTHPTDPKEPSPAPKAAARPKSGDAHSEEETSLERKRADAMATLQDLCRSAAEGQYDGRGFLETMQHLKAMEEFRRTCSEDSTSEAGATEASPMHVEEVSSDGDEDRSAEQIPRKAPQKRRKAASNSFSESRRELEKASEDHIRALLEMEEEERQQKEKTQEERDEARREKRRAKAKKKKGRGREAQEAANKVMETGTEAALSVFSAPTPPGEGSSKESSPEEPLASKADQMGSSTAAAASPSSEAKPEPTNSEIPLPIATGEETDPEPLAVQEVDAVDSSDSESSLQEGSSAWEAANASEGNSRQGATKSLGPTKPPGMTKPPGATKPPGVLHQEGARGSTRPAFTPPPQYYTPPPQSVAAAQIDPADASPAPLKSAGPPRPAGYALPEQQAALHQVWSAMEAGLETGDAAQLSSAMNRAEAWLANHGTSKVFLAANTELREKLARARMLTGCQPGPRFAPSAGRGAPPYQRPGPRGPRPVMSGRVGRPPPNLDFESAFPAARGGSGDDPFGGVAAGNSAPYQTYQPRPMAPHPARGSWYPNGPPSRPRMPFRSQPPPSAAQAHAHWGSAGRYQPARGSEPRLTVPLAFDQPSTAAAGENEESNMEEPECIVCLEWPPEVVLLPCGHRDMCAKCAEEVRLRGGGLCPTCRTPIIEVVQPE